MGGVFLKSLSSQVDAEATALGSGVGSPSCSRPQLPEWPQEMPSFHSSFWSLCFNRVVESSEKLKKQEKKKKTKPKPYP